MKLQLLHIAGALLATAVAAAQAPDTILAHGKILTMDEADTIAEALAIRDGKIFKVGTDAAILALAAPGTKIIDLHGRTATPGLIDTHGHFADGGVDELYHVDLSHATSIAEVVRLVGDRAKTLKSGEWLEGDGWDEGKLRELRYVRAADLDPVTPNHPVWLLHTTGHYGVANSRALALAHVTAATPDPPAGTIDRAPDGAPTGVLKEAAMAAVSTLIPPPTLEQEKAGILHVLAELHAEGMTSVKDADIPPQTWTAYTELLAEGKLDERVCVLWHAGTTMDTARATLARIQAQPRPPASLGDGRLLSCGAKLYMDGSGGARTAWLTADWDKNLTGTDTGNRGYPAMDPETYRDAVRLFHQAGINVGTHAIGDRAIDWVVDTYAQVLEEKPTPRLRHSIIHANIPSDHAIATMSALEHQYDAAYPESQAPFMWWIGDTYAGNFGPARDLRLDPFATYMRKGIRWGGGSDYFVTPLPARYGIWASVERETLKGVYGSHPFGMAEAVDVHAALRSYTSWAAPQLFLEDRVGSLTVGKRADIAIWKEDPYTIPARELKNMHCVQTFFDGKVVFDESSTSGVKKSSQGAGSATPELAASTRGR